MLAAWSGLVVRAANGGVIAHEQREQGSAMRCWDQVADRLRAAGHATSPGGHEAMLSQPGPLADVLLKVCQ